MWSVDESVAGNLSEINPGAGERRPLERIGR